MPDLDSDLYRTALARSEHGKAEWIEGILEMAALLFRKKQELGGSLPAFGKWLVENGVKELHSDDDRAALVGLGSDLALAREKLMETTLTSLRAIWRQDKIHFRKPAKMEISNQKEAPVSCSPSINGRIIALAKDRKAEGITSGDAVSVLSVLSSTASASLSRLSADGMLTKTSRRRPNPAGNSSSVFVHNDFSDARLAHKKARVETVEHEFWRPSTLTREELGKPTLEEALLPDLDRPGLNREQGYVAKWGHVQIGPLRERKRGIVKRLPAALRNLDEPLTTFMEQVVILVPAPEVMELLDDRTRGKLIERLRAVRENLERSWRYVESLEVALNQSDKVVPIRPVQADAS